MKNPQWLDFLGLELFQKDHKEYPIGRYLANLTLFHWLELPSWTIVLPVMELNIEKFTTFNLEYDSITMGRLVLFTNKTGVILESTFQRWPKNNFIWF